MSKSSNRMFVCPKCSKEYEIMTWDSINVSIDPDLRDKLFHNEIFKYECPHCHEVYQIVYPCLYHDPENKMMVWLVDGKTEKDLVSNDTLPLAIAKGYTYRYCKKIMEFVEKIRVLEEGLDDRIVEMAKMFCEKQIVDSKKASAEEIDYTVYNTIKDEIVEFASMANGEIIRMHLNYKDFEDLFNREEDGYDVEENKFVRINKKWMLKKATEEYEKQQRS